MGCVMGLEARALPVQADVEELLSFHSSVSTCKIYELTNHKSVDYRAFPYK
jgi:hypothetical protein